MTYDVAEVDSLQAVLPAVLAGETLSERVAKGVFRLILTGAGDDAQIAALLALLQQRGVTVDELTGAARVMRDVVTPVPVADRLRPRLLDTCGTGGAPKTFNISTAAALIVAGAGLMLGDETGPAVAVAKHGNRSRTGRGSAEVLQHLGVNIDASPETQARCLESAGVCFCFAIRHHPAMKHAAGPRRSLGFPTVFNLLGPLTNPAGARRQLLGVYDARFVPLLAETLGRLGAERAMVVHGDDGLDELTTTTTSRAAEVDAAGTASGTTTLDATSVQQRVIDAEQLGLRSVSLDDLRVDSAEQGAALIERILTPDIVADRSGLTDVAERIVQPCCDIALLNAAAALSVAGLADSLGSGLDIARRAITERFAMRALTTLRDCSRG
jgi:anthranilate phosphoribosyltransferase